MEELLIASMWEESANDCRSETPQEVPHTSGRSDTQCSTRQSLPSRAGRSNRPSKYRRQREVQSVLSVGQAVVNGKQRQLQPAAAPHPFQKFLSMLFFS